MYKNGEVALDRILELIGKCPKELQEKCFEVLLSGYVQLEVGMTKPQTPPAYAQQGQEKKDEIRLPNRASHLQYFIALGQPRNG